MLREAEADSGGHTARHRGRNGEPQAFADVGSVQPLGRLEGEARQRRQATAETGADQPAPAMVARPSGDDDTQQQRARHIAAQNDARGRGLGTIGHGLDESPPQAGAGRAAEANQQGAEHAERNRLVGLGDGEIRRHGNSVAGPARCGETLPIVHGPVGGADDGYDRSVTAPAPTTEFAATADGTSQLQRHWKAEGVDTPRAAVLLVHGIGEHSGRYLHVGAHLAAEGYDVLAFDNRGFGQSGGRRAYVDSFDQFIDDIGDLLAERRSLGVPVVLFGHSLGGLMSASYLVSGRPRPDLAVLSSPALAANIPTWQRASASLLNKAVPKFFLPDKGDGSLLSRDPAVQRGFVEDPLVIQGATVRLGYETLSRMKSTSASIDRITVPLYVLHGALDELVPPSASEGLGTLPNATRRLWPGLRHECLNEPEQDEVLAELVAWLDQQLEAQTEGVSSSEPST